MQQVLPHVEPIILAGAGVLLAAAGARDVASRVVPNAIPAALLVLGIGFQLLEGSLPSAVFLDAFVFLAAFLCWRRGWVGGGDVKLLGAAGMLVPPARLPAMISSIAIAGGVLALIYLALPLVLTRPAAPRPAGQLARIARIERWRITRRYPLPYASAIAVGALFEMLSK